MNVPQYEELEHTADWALRVQGRDLKEPFLHAAQGMFSLEGAVPGPGKRKQITIDCSADDQESLLVMFLEELLFHVEMGSITYEQIKIDHISAKQISAQAIAAPMQESKKHIKAVTYHELAIVETPEGLETTIIFDV
jgi:SHS2 domain-containing protein